MSTALSIPQELKTAFFQVLSDDSPVNWVLYGYDKGQSILKLSGSGEGGLEELQEEFDENKIQYAFARVIEPISKLSKLILISWCGDGVPQSKKGLYSFHVQDVERFFQGFHVHINGRQEADIEPATIMKKVKDSSGAKYAISERVPVVGGTNRAQRTPVRTSFTNTGNTGNTSFLSYHCPSIKESSNFTKVEPVSPSQANPYVSNKPVSNNVQDSNSNYQQQSWSNNKNYDGTNDDSSTNVDLISSLTGQRQNSFTKQEAFRRPELPNSPADYTGNILARQHEIELESAMKREREERERYDREEKERLAALANDTGNDIRKKREEQERLEREREMKKANHQAGGNSAFGAQQAYRKWEENNNNTDLRQQRLEQERLERERETERLAKLNLNNNNHAVGHGYTSAQYSSSANGEDIRRRRADQEREEREREEKRLAKLKLQQDNSAAEAQALQRQYSQSKQYQQHSSQARESLSGVSASNTTDSFASTTGVYRQPSAKKSVASPSKYSNEYMINQQQQQRKNEKDEQRRTEEVLVQEREKEELGRQQQREPEEMEEKKQKEDAILKAQQASTNAARNGTSDAPIVTNTPNAGLSAIVLYDYEPMEGNEIGLLEGSRVTNIAQLDEGWWQGTNVQGQSGLFPANYVELESINNSQISTTDFETSSYRAPEPAPIAPTLPKPEAIAAYDYDAAEENEMSFREGDLITDIEFVSEDWWQGTCQGRIGLFPSNYVTLR